MPNTGQISYKVTKLGLIRKVLKVYEPGTILRLTSYKVGYEYTARVIHSTEEELEVESMVLEHSINSRFFITPETSYEIYELITHGF